MITWLHGTSASRHDLIREAADHRHRAWPGNPGFRSTFHAYLEWGTRIAVINGQTPDPQPWDDQLDAPFAGERAVEPVSTIVTRTVPAAKAAQFDELLHGVIAAARTFDGHLVGDSARDDSEVGAAIQILADSQLIGQFQFWQVPHTRRRLKSLRH